MPINENKLQELQSHHNSPSQSSPNAVPRSAQQVSGTFEEILLENNKLLKKLVRHQRWAVFFSFLKLMIFVVIPTYYAYQHKAVIEDYLNMVLNSVRTLQSTAEQLKDPAKNININELYKILQK